jgi:tryptophan-rich sensory protein
MLDAGVVRVILTAWNNRSRKGLLLNVGFAVALVLILNAAIFVFNPSEMASTGVRFRFEPPGWVIGMVWILLFAWLGTARWLVLGRDGRRSSDAAWVFCLLLFCAAYPVYTAGLRSAVVGLLGNAATGCLALWIAFRIRARSVLAAGLVSAVAAWVTFASILSLEQIRGRSF